MTFSIGKAKRKINGQWFTLHKVAKTKRAADFEAKAWRMKRGTPARVMAYRVDGKGYWAVWVR